MQKQSAALRLMMDLDEAKAIFQKAIGTFKFRQEEVFEKLFVQNYSCNKNVICYQDMSINMFLSSFGF